MSDNPQAEIDALRKKLAELEARAMSAASGVSVSGAEKVDIGGDVVGRDKLTTIYNYYQTAPEPAKLNSANFERILTDYLRWVRTAYGKARLYGLESLPTTRTNQPRELQDVFIPLTLRRFKPLLRADIEQLARDVKDEMAEARAYLKLAEAQYTKGDTITLENLLVTAERLAIVGGAGSGKSTLLAYFAAELASNAPPNFRLPAGKTALVPLIIPLRYYREYLRLCREAPEMKLKHPRTGTLVGFIPWYLQRRTPVLETSEDFFDRLLLGGGCLVMLDGLDEVVTRADRGRVRHEVEQLVYEVFPGNRFIITAREAGYREDAVFGDDFTRLDVQKLEREQILGLVSKWGRQLYAGEEEARTAQIMKAIDSIHELRADRNLPPLISTPLMVTMVVGVQWGETELPRERARLYEACVKVMLQAQYVLPDDARQEITEWSGPWEDQRNWLSKLALAMHAGGEAGAAVPEEQVRAALEDELPPEALNKFIQAVRDRGGLLEERAELFQFAHLTFQEFLAARWLAKQRQAGLTHLEKRLADPWWREVVLLTHNYAQFDYVPFARDYLNWLSQRKAAGVELAGAALLELERPDEATRQRHAQRLVEALRDPNLSAAVRVQVGNTLAGLGDHRFREDLCFLPDEPLLGFVEIPAGSFLMGTRAEDVPALMKKHGGEKNWYEWETPQHIVELSTYYIARYPVTVAQFAAFAQHSGYRPRDVGGLTGQAHHPVVNVTWEDAITYSRWLTDTLKNSSLTPAPLTHLLHNNWQVTLPTEAQWEKAARGILPSPPGRGDGDEGAGRVFPWGDEFDANKANVEATGIGTTSVVGCFPDPHLSYGLLDMSGNVWEWCADWFDEKVYQRQSKGAPKDPTGPKNGDQRVLRGGAFLSDAWVARCARRNWHLPVRRVEGIGFRVVVAPFRL